MDYKSRLEELMRIFAPSGYEGEMIAFFKEEIGKFADSVKVDRVGNVIASFAGTDPLSPKVMIFAHMDQIGFVVRKIEANGFLRVDRLGGVAEKILPGLNLRVQTRGGSHVNGVFATKSMHASSAADASMAEPIASLFVDIGASSREDVLRLGVDIGCPATYAPCCRRLAGDFVSGTAVDNRGGITALLGAAELISKSAHKSDVFLVGTVWEEFNVRGAVFAAREVKPDIAIALDVVMSGDTGDLAPLYDTACGSGPAIEYYSFHGRGTLNGTIAHAGLAKLAEDAATAENIPFQRFAGLGILTDSAYVQMEGNGAAMLEIGFPVRYTHSPVETVNVCDIEHLAALLHAMTVRIDASFDLNRFALKSYQQEV